MDIEKKGTLHKFEEEKNAVTESEKTPPNTRKKYQMHVSSTKARELVAGNFNGSGTQTAVGTSYC